MVLLVSRRLQIVVALLGVALFQNVATGFLHTTTTRPMLSTTSNGKIVQNFELLASSSAAAGTVEEGNTLNDKQIEFTLGYMNKHHPDVLRAFAESFSSLGQIMRKKNAWSGGSYEIKDAKAKGIDNDEMELEVTIVERESTKLETIKFDLGMSCFL